MKKITITKKNGQIGVLEIAEDGNYNITINGQRGPGNNYYTPAQVEKIIATATSAGEKIEIE